MVVSRLVRRMMPCAVSVTLVLSMITAGMVASSPSAAAAGTVLFNQPFHDNTVDGPAGSVSLPTAPPAQRQPAARRQRHQRVRKYHGQLGPHHPGERPLHRHKR